MKLVNADVIIEKWRERVLHPLRIEDFSPGLALALKDLTNAPAVDAVPVQHAYWKVFSAHETETVFKCSKCNNTVKHKNTFPGMPEKYVGSYIRFCSHCGARMSGGAENGSSGD